MNFNYFMPTRVISDKGCVTDFKFDSFGRRCLIVTSKTAAYKSGLMADLEENLKSRKIEYFIYDEVVQNPSVYSCFEIAKLALDFSADFIIGAGGGSPMDTAKAVAVFAANESLTPHEIFTYKGSRALPIILIGTTAGTGSEVTPYSVLTINDKNGVKQKRSFKNPVIFADVALCDASYTMSLPWEITVNTALDTICHAIEGLYSKRCNDYSKIYALSAIEICWSSLKRAYWMSIVEKKVIDFDTRNQLLLASIMSGLTINITGTCFPHTFGYALTTKNNIPHGRACAVFIGEFVRRMAPHNAKYTEELARVCGEESVDAFLDAIMDLIYDMPVLTNSEALEYAEKLENSPALTAGIADITTDDAYSIYKKLFCSMK